MKRSRPLRHALCATVLAATPAAAQAVLPPAPPEAVPAGAVPAEAPPENPPSVAVPQPTPPTTQEAQPASTTEAAQAGPAEGAQPAAPANPAPATPAAPAAQEPIISVGEVQIFGDDFEMDPQTGLTTVTGNPRAVRGDEEIRATRMIINPRTRQFTAEGDVIIRQAGREFRTTRATYNFDEQTGQVEDVRTVLKNYHVRAGQLLLKPGPRYEGRRTRFTTCDREHPHYSIFARSLEIVPEQYLEARHASLSLMGLRLLTIPRLRKSLRPRDDDDDGRSLIPSIGYNSYNGPYVRDQFQLRTKNPVWIDADVQLNTFNEPNAGIRAATPGRLQYVGSLFYRDIAENQRAPHLQVSRLPELGVVWRPGQVPRPGQFLPHQVPGVRYPRELDISTNWRFAGQITGGFFRQHRGDRTNLHDSESTSAARLSVQGQGVLPVLRAGPVRLNDLRFLVRQNWYDTGQSHLVFGTGIGKKFRMGNFRFRIDRFDQFTSGSTPFLFDDVELRQEWRPQLDYATRGFSVSYSARLRGHNFDLYDQVFSVAKLFHCIEPRLTYRVRRQEFFLEVRIPGISGNRRSRPGEPRSSDVEEEPAPPTDTTTPAASTTPSNP